MSKLLNYVGLPGTMLVALMLASAVAVAEETATEKLPIQRIVLFNSGVGFFEHRGEVNGDDQLSLEFNTDDVNDLLKSMVVEDLDGGRIATVGYGSRDPITKTLQSYSVNLEGNPTLFNLLVQLRGEDLIVHAPNEISGTLVGTESRPQAVGQGQPISVDYLTLMTDEGLQTLAFSSVSRIQLANAALQKEFQAALKTLASGHNNDKKTITLDFRGQGKRQVRVGYIQEAPVWKTSYRLVLNDKDGEAGEAQAAKSKSHLQGWAIVENTSERDWHDVQLSLVSGRPISFQMDLYSPLYAPRPTVQMELYSSLTPQLHEQDIFSRKQKRSVQSGVRDEAAEGDEADLGRFARVAGAAGFEADGGGMGGGLGGVEPPAASGLRNFGASAPSVAQGGDVGELFRYEIDMPVSIARQRSAMLPIVNQKIKTEKLSIYNQAVHAKHPLNAVRLKNTTDLHLMQGPVTVFDGGVYAGDAKLGDLAAGAERLVSYALDLDVEVAPSEAKTNTSLASVKIVKGVLETTNKAIYSQTFTIKNSGESEKSVLLEHRKRSGWELVEPKQVAEKTRTDYRIAVEAAPGETVEQPIVLERIQRQSMALGVLQNRDVQVYFSATEISDEVKEALQKVSSQYQQLAELTQQKSQLQGELKTIDSEQARIRQNMQQLPRDSQLYKRYVAKFTEQEDKIESLRVEIAELEKKEQEQRKTLEDYIKGLDVE